MPCFRHTSPADNPAACSFSTLMICSSVNLLLRMSVSSEERTLPKNRGHLRGAGQAGPNIRLTLDPAADIDDCEVSYYTSEWLSLAIDNANPPPAESGPSKSKPNAPPLLVQVAYGL